MTLPFDPQSFDEEVLKPNGITAFFGVPDSSLSGLLSYFYAHKQPTEHVVTANEGGAVALAAGYHLSTKRVALVYMQNSGFANALNPLQSLAAKEVFGIPMLLVVGWRGRPGEKDEPQHALVGPHILNNISANDIPYEIMPNTIAGARDSVARLVAKAIQNSTPAILIVLNRSFIPYNGQPMRQRMPEMQSVQLSLHLRISMAEGLLLSRELTIRYILEYVKTTDITVSSLGGNSREVYMIQKEKRRGFGRNFLCIGAMGHAFALVCGLAMGFCSGRVFCIDGECSFLMHIGNNAMLADFLSWRVVHVVIYNGVHSSTGGHPLMIERDNFLAIAMSLPYKQKFIVNDVEGLERACKSAQGNALIVVVVNDNVRKDLPRPVESCYDLKSAFMSSILPVSKL
jgi:phosphonopyruvate decarboxylase